MRMALSINCKSSRLEPAMTGAALVAAHAVCEPAQVAMLMAHRVHPQVKPEERLGFRGADDIRAHPWFEGLDWAALEARSVLAPITPELASPVDTSNFDDFSDPPATPRFPPGQPDPNAAAWADLWDWIEQPPDLAAAPAPLGRRASGAAAGLAALRAASLSLATAKPSAAAADTASPTRTASAVQQAQERLQALQLQTEPWRASPAATGEDGEQHVPLSSGVPQSAEVANGQDIEQTQLTDRQQAETDDISGPEAMVSSGVQPSAFAAGALNVASGGRWSSSDGSAGSPVKAVLPPIATSLHASQPAAATHGTGTSQPVAEPMPRGNSDPSLNRPVAVSLPDDLPVYAASADGLVSPLASAGRIDLSGEMSEKGHFVITAGGLVNPAANAGKIVLELDATDTDKFMALDSGIVSPTARSGRIILLPEETAK